MAEEVSIKDVIEYYRSTFVPAYADLVSTTGNKPHQVLVEIENFNSHLIQCLQHPDTDLGKRNISRALTHLQRGTLDCYKLIFVELNDRIKVYMSDLTVLDIEFSLGSEHKANLSKWHKFSEDIRHARRQEVCNTGQQHNGEIVALWKDAVEHGFSLLNQLNEAQARINSIRKHMFMASLKSHWPYHLAEVILGSIIGAYAHSAAINYLHF